MVENPTAGFVAVPGGRIYYERTGAGPAIVLIHSAFLDRREWEPQFGSYATDHTVVRFDVRGAGRSEGDESDDFSSAEDLLELLNRLDLPKAYLVGNSDGARIACEFAAGLPDRVVGLVPVAGAPHDLDPTSEEQARFLEGDAEAHQRLVSAMEDGRRAEAIELILDIWAPRVTAADRSRLREITRDNYEHFARFMARDRPPGRAPGYPVGSTLVRAGLPILSLAGAFDKPALNMMMARFAQTVPSARHHVLAGGDHTPSLSDRGEFDAAVLDFVTRLERGDAWPPPAAGPLRPFGSPAPV